MADMVIEFTLHSMIKIRASSHHLQQLIDVLKIVAPELPLTEGLVIAQQYANGKEVHIMGNPPQFWVLCAIAKPWAQSIAGDNYTLVGEGDRIILKGLPD